MATNTAAREAAQLRLRTLSARIDAELEDLRFPNQPALLYEPARYALQGGGKRLRPVVLLLAAEIQGAPMEDALPAALAVEIFHNFTLVHDDIMDHAPTRRGREAVHVRWDEATAILAGDYLMALSYRFLVAARAPDAREVLRVFDEMVEQLCEGQALDKSFEVQDEVVLEEYMRMIDAKTGALLRASLEIGGLVGGASDAQRWALRQAGLHLGRAFQIQDDLLDLVADDRRWGKEVGSDLVEGKKTYLLIRALERASGEDLAFLRRVGREGGISAEFVDEARARMESAGALDDARAAVRRHSEAALAQIDALEGEPAPRDALVSIVEGMRVRVR